MQTKQLIVTLKTELKKAGVTYGVVAQHLQLSESSIKRLLNQADISLSKLEKIAALAHLTLEELMQMAALNSQLTEQLTLQQEQQIVEDDKLLLVTILLLNHWRFSEIITHYQFSELELIRLTATLDRLNIVELLPGNRVKSKLSNQFQWQKHGPLENYFKKNIQAEYFNSAFDGQDTLHFSAGMLTQQSIEKIKYLYQQLIREIGELLKSDKQHPVSERKGMAFALTIRDWEYSRFAALKRENNSCYDE